MPESMQLNAEKGVGQVFPDELSLRLELLNESNLPQLISILKAYRSANSAENQSDKNNLSESILKARAYLLEHNHFLFLLLTGNFAELYKLYGDYLTENMGILIGYIENEFVRFENQQNSTGFSVKIKTSSQSQQITPEETRLILIGNMVLFGFYQEMIQKEHSAYAITRAAIYSNAAISQINILNQAIFVITKNGTLPLTSEQKKAFIDDKSIFLSDTDKELFLSEVENQQIKLAGLSIALDNATEFLKNNPTSLEAAENQLKAAKQLFDETAFIGKLLEKYKGVSPELRKLDDESKAITAQVQVRLDEARVNHERKIAEITTQLENVSKVAKIDIVTRFADLMRFAEQCPSGQYDASLNQAIKMLRQYEEKLFNTADYHVIQSLLSNCVDEFLVIEKMLEKGRPDLINEFRDEVKALKQMILIPVVQHNAVQQSVLNDNIAAAINVSSNAAADSKVVDDKFSMASAPPTSPEEFEGFLRGLLDEDPPPPYYAESYTNGVAPNLSREQSQKNNSRSGDMDSAFEKPFPGNGNENSQVVIANAPLPNGVIGNGHLNQSVMNANLEFNTIEYKKKLNANKESVTAKPTNSLMENDEGSLVIPPNLIIQIQTEIDSIIQEDDDGNIKLQDQKGLFICDEIKKLTDEIQDSIKQVGGVSESNLRLLCDKFGELEKIRELNEIKFIPNCLDELNKIIDSHNNPPAYAP